MEIEVKENYELKNLTSFKIGGCAERLWLPKNREEMVYLLKILKKPLIFGGWSNVLISSNGIEGDAISTAKFANIDFNSTRVLADCGVKGAYLAQKAQEKGLSGFEFMIGFPGTVGGNVYMNASAQGQSISDFLVNAYVWNGKTLQVLTKEDLEFDYRSSVLQKNGAIILSAGFNLKVEDKEKIKAQMDKNLEFRKSHQPNLSLPNAGSVFKNPPEQSAGALLEQVGAKHFEVGKAKIFKNHANFIVNMGGATSQDVLELMLKMHENVKKKFDIKLKPEIKFFGKKTEREEEICKILYAK